MLIDLKNSQSCIYKIRRYFLRIDGDFAPELILDLARFDSIWRIFADDLKEVLNTHCAVALNEGRRSEGLGVGSV